MIDPHLLLAQIPFSYPGHALGTLLFEIIKNMLDLVYVHGTIARTFNYQPDEIGL